MHSSLVQPDAGEPNRMSCSPPSLSYGCETGTADGTPCSITGLVQVYILSYASYAHSYDLCVLRPVALVCGSETAPDLMKHDEPCEMNSRPGKLGPSTRQTPWDCVLGRAGSLRFMRLPIFLSINLMQVDGGSMEYWGTLVPSLGCNNPA